MYSGVIKGLMCWGQNPAVGGPNANLERKALEKLVAIEAMRLFTSYEIADSIYAAIVRLLAEAFKDAAYKGDQKNANVYMKLMMVFIGKMNKTFPKSKVVIR